MHTMPMMAIMIHGIIRPGFSWEGSLDAIFMFALLNYLLREGHRGQQIAELFAFLKKWIPPLIQPCTGKTVICEENFLKKLFGEELPTLFRLFINISKDQVLFIVQIYAVPYHILLSLKCV